MSWKKKTIKSKKKVNLAELRKWLQNIEVISKFVEKTGSRHNVRTKLVEILLSYLSNINLRLPVPSEKELHLNLMKVLGFCLVYFFISIFVLLFLLFLYFNLYNRFSH
jgi:hypothetical protein